MMTSPLTFLSLCLTAIQAATTTGPAYSLADYDDDGLVDVYVVHVAGDRLFRNLGDGSFHDVTTEAGLAGLAGSRDALWQDFDGDGHIDLYVSLLGGHGRLFQNTGAAVFVDATELAGFERTAGELDAAWLDYDADLRPDLYVAAAEGDVLYRNAGSGRFERVELVPIPDEAGGIVLAPGTDGESALAAESATTRGGAATRTRRAHPSGLAGAPRFAQPLSAGAGGGAATLPLIAAPSACASALRDAVGGGCTLQASSTPTLGMLYPLSTALNVSLDGNVNIGTSSNPGSKLAVLGAETSLNGEAAAIRIQNTAAGGGVWMIRAGANGTYTPPGSFSVGDALGYKLTMLPNGNVGIGTSHPEKRLQVDQPSPGGDGIGVLFGPQFSGGPYNQGTQRIGVAAWNGNAGLSLLRHGQIGFLTEVDATGFSIKEGYQGEVGERLRIQASSGNVGLGTAAPVTKLDIVGSVHTRGTSQDFSVPPGEAIQFGHFDGTTFTERVRIQSDGDLVVQKTTRTGVLQITGGSDVAEPFDITSTPAGLTPERGMVMVIDRTQDGRLVPCTDDYDKAVAGVLSGANDLEPGMVLRAEGRPLVAGGGDTMPLAMAGRVWVWCDAAYGPIGRGDALTTSRTPGHAMLVTDEARASRAVIGKAMTELPEGRGLVLVLVNLQ